MADQLKENKIGGVAKPAKPAEPAEHAKLTKPAESVENVEVGNEGLPPTKPAESEEPAELTEPTKSSEPKGSEEVVDEGGANESSLLLQSKKTNTVEPVKPAEHTKLTKPAETIEVGDGGSPSTSQDEGEEVKKREKNIFQKISDWVGELLGNNGSGDSNNPEKLEGIVENDPKNK
jgi:hypothetical protein